MNSVLKPAANYWNGLFPVQRVSLAAGTSFLLYLVLCAGFASRPRGGHVHSHVENGGSAKTTEGSALFLQDFSRVMLRKGKKSLEVRAKTGKYLPQERVTYLSESEVRVQRETGKPITIRSRNARLFMEGEQVREADLEGDVQVELDSGMTIYTELAHYDAESQIIRSPEAVRIVGTGFVTRGDGMETEVEAEIVRLQRDVHSHFEHGAVLPNLAEKK